MPASRGKWKEVSNVVGELGTLLTDKKGTLAGSCDENMKRETEVLVMADELKSTGKTDEDTRAIIMCGLERLRKIKENEAAKELLGSSGGQKATTGR